MSQERQQEIKFLRLQNVLAATGMCRSTLYHRIADGSFPRPIKLSERSVAWVESDIQAWMQARIGNLNSSQSNQTYGGGDVERH